MKFIFASLFVIILLSEVSAGYGYGHESHHDDHFAPANYKFEYAVADPHTGDKKQQYEYRHGDVVKGGYSLHEPDGTIRVVEYTSGPHTGFNAIVKRIGHANHPQVYHSHGNGGHAGHGRHGGYGGAESFVGVTRWGSHGHH